MRFKKVGCAPGKTMNLSHPVRYFNKISGITSTFLNLDAAMRSNYAKSKVSKTDCKLREQHTQAELIQTRTSASKLHC